MGNERRIGLSLSGNIPLSQLSKLAKEAEVAGFESLWIHETYFMRDAVTQLAVSALSTKTMKLATGCINPFTRNTTVIAMTLATLDEYSPGRFILGIGTGYPLRLNQMGIDLLKPVQQLEKRIEEIRQLLRGNAIQKGAKLMFRLPDRSIPIFIGVRKKAMLRMAARVADGYIAAPAESIQSTRRIVSELNSNRPFGKMEVASNILTQIAKTEEEALEIARKDPFVTYMMAVLDDRTLTESGFSLEDREKIALPYMKGKLEEASSKIRDEMLQSFTAVGDYDSVVEKLAEFRKAGVDLPLLLPIKADVESLKMIMQITPYYISA
jgi:5,10-methylenetetrahydromethanopterin reductase